MNEVPIVATQKKLTPLMTQYVAIREQYPDMLLLFQVGDFYELFFEDAQKASAYLGIALTKRGNINGEPIPLCGVPMHALQHYLLKLVRGGFKVAICDQLEEATPGKVVERGVTQVLTPGTLTDVQMLDAKSASYLCSFFPAETGWGLLFGELLTAQLFGTVIPAENRRQLEAEIARFMPDEIILPHTQEGKQFAGYFKQMGYIASFEHTSESLEPADIWLEKQLHTKGQNGIQKHIAFKAAVHSFYGYLKRNNAQALYQFNELHCYEADDYLMLDAATQRNLELVSNRQDAGKAGTLFSVLDKAVTAMGSRMVKKWLARPLVRKEHILQRQEVLALLLKETALSEQIAVALKGIGDLERIVGRIALKRAGLGDFLALRNALALIPEITRLLQQHQSAMMLDAIACYLIDFASLHQLLQAALYDAGEKDWLIKSKFDQELDYMRELIDKSHETLLAMEAKEQRETGISSLKIRYNTVSGYAIEVTNTHKNAIPAHYIRQQTLVGKERFMTTELQELQVEIEQAKDRVGALEKEVFERIKNEVEAKVHLLRKVAHALAHLDALWSLAYAARAYDFVMPIFNDHRTIAITGGRHPVVQAALQKPFIPNDTLLDDAQSLWIITGPNMGGKSTYLRQVAHICIMAQIGSFVPADKADLPLLDRIFTRIGSGDNLVDGKSTFLVEMEETATICTQATERSLVILDEVGRGTSTFDGLAIAQSVVEYIYKRLQARCIFATHYHELTQLEQTFPGIVSYHAASKKTADGILFLYQIKRGVADGSFGIQVAKLADLPQEIIERSEEILISLKNKEVQLSSSAESDAEQVNSPDSYFQLKKAYVKAEADAQAWQEHAAFIGSIDFDQLSPKKAFDLLWELGKRTKRGERE